MSFQGERVFQDKRVSQVKQGMVKLRPFLVLCLTCGVISGLRGNEPSTDSGFAKDFATTQSLLRLPPAIRNPIANQRADSVRRYLSAIVDASPSDFLAIATKLNVSDIDSDLLRIAKQSNDLDASIRAIDILLQRGGVKEIEATLHECRDETMKKQWIERIGALDRPDAVEMIASYLTDDESLQTMLLTANKLGKTRHGQAKLLRLARAGEIPNEALPLVSDSLYSSRNKKFRESAKAIKSLTPSIKGKTEAVPPIRELLSQRGSVARGKKVFAEQGTCAKCHKVAGDGKEVGPDLSEIGSKLSRTDMYTAILYPSAAISHNYETFAVLTIDGDLVTGLLVGDNDNNVSIRTAEGITKKIDAEDIDEKRKQEVSLMPADLQKNMTTEDLVDVVEYMTSLKRRGDKKVTSAGPVSREADDAIDGFNIAEGLVVQLFAYEPMMYSPTAIDVDDRGRVWVCEAVNYRHFRNPDNQPRDEGDRILIMTDTDGDGHADETKVFYQGTDINSPHGVCVLDDSVIVSAGANVFRFQDTNGDDIADQKEVLFTGISGVDHDHGIHSFMPGPDGKLYFNFGNEGKQLRDANGKPIVDAAGNVIDDSRKPYQQGMVFRCDLDGTNVETLGWNFRNNWEVAVDSFGAMWQSDNDDDGNRGTRINYVMEYGNYGYRDEKTGDQWRAHRMNLESEIPLQHWHLNDPGVIPNLLQTGAGSPTGMMVYEGNLLPEVFHGQMIHTDPGPNVVRSYPVKKDGAGYSAKVVNMIEGVADQWFRPVDAVAAPDGSVIVADWYDPGVGGHRMGDTKRGRLFRITVPGHEAYQVKSPDYASLDGCLAALESPNVMTRFRAWKQLEKRFKDSAPDPKEFINDADQPNHRARRMWLLSKIPTTAESAIEVGLADVELDVRLAAIRAARQCESFQKESLMKRFIDDPSAAIRRELLITIREMESSSPAQQESISDWWVRLAQQYDGVDRWYLEAVGLAADGRWEWLLPKWKEQVGDQWKQAPHRDIAWRSRSQAAADMLATLIQDSDSVAEQAKYFRALDLAGSKGIQSALRKIAEAK